MYFIAYYTSLISNIFPLLGGIYFYSKFKKDKVQSLFFIYAIYIVVTQIINTTIAKLGYYNIWFFELSLFLEIAYFYWFYNAWDKFKNWFKWLTLIVFIYIAVLMFMKYVVLHTEKTVSYTFPILIIYFIVQCSMAIIKTFEKSDTEFNKSYIFWISFARLFYFMAILPFNIFAYIDGFLEGEVKVVYQYADAYVNHFANIVLNSLFLYSFKCRN